MAPPCLLVYALDVPLEEGRAWRVGQEKNVSLHGLMDITNYERGEILFLFHNCPGGNAIRKQELLRIAKQSHISIASGYTNSAAANIALASARLFIRYDATLLIHGTLLPREPAVSGDFDMVYGYEDETVYNAKLKEQGKLRLDQLTEQIVSTKAKRSARRDVFRKMDIARTDPDNVRCAVTLTAEEVEGCQLGTMIPRDQSIRECVATMGIVLEQLSPQDQLRIFLDTH